MDIRWKANSFVSRLRSSLIWHFADGSGAAEVLVRGATVGAASCSPGEPRLWNSALYLLMFLGLAHWPVILQQLTRRGETVLMATHDIEFAHAFASRTVSLVEGRLV